MIKKLLSLVLVLHGFLLFAQESYYNDVDLTATGLELKENLAIKIINTHTNTLSYSDVWTACKATDVVPTDASKVFLLYGYTETGKTARTKGINENGGGGDDWNREHTYAQSLGTPKLGKSGPGADAHHLRPTHLKINSTRGNRKFTNSSGNSKIVGDFWYPGDEWKGDVARMMMYMYLRYNSQCLPGNVGVGDKGGTPDDMIDLFLVWNAEDPVSEIEINRNNYHENTANEAAQGNRNPFIDNPYLATRIWGGVPAEDRWGIYVTKDSEAPTTPTNITFTNITTKSFEIHWSASTDNISVTSYEIFVNGDAFTATNTNSYFLDNLQPNTNYSIEILATDEANNKSAKSTAKQATTLTDITAPSVPKNIVIDNQTDVSFKISWDVSTDDTRIEFYEIFVNSQYTANTNTNSYTLTGLTKSTSYNIEVLAADESNNKSAKSAVVVGTTTDGVTQTANELFISEYIEGSGNNKALELVNITDHDIDLSNYSIKRQSDGEEQWQNELVLSGTLVKNDVYVIVNSKADMQKLFDEANLVVQNTYPNYGAPLNFNGNDPVGLFKNGTLIDIIGVFNGGSSNFAEDITLRRKSAVSGPNSVFDKNNEWDNYPENTVEDLGQHKETLHQNSFIKKINLKLFPNPVSNGVLYIQSDEQVFLKIYNILGKKVLEANILAENDKLDISRLKSGVYLLKINSKNNTITKKLIIK